MDEFCGNTFWDTNLTWYTEDPDLTPCFQNTVLVWVPCAFLWIWSVYALHVARYSYTKNVPWNALNVLKLGFSALLALVQILELGWLLADTGSDHSAADYATPALKLATFALVLFLDVYNRRQGIRSSGTVFLFWFLLAVCEAIGFRAAIRLGTTSMPADEQRHPKYGILYFYILEVIYYPLILGQLLLNCWADAPPRDHGPIPVGDKPCPEHGSSFPSRLLFVWFEKLARMGYKTPLEVDHLWNLNPEDTSRYLNPIFHGYWTAALEKVRGKGKTGASVGAATTVPASPQVTYSKNSIEFKPVGEAKPKSKATASVLPPLAKMFGGTFMFASLISLLRDLLTFTTPQILNLLIGHVSEGNTEETWKGYTYAVLLFLANTASTLMGNQYNYMLFLMGMKIRTVVVSAIYRKAVRISNAAREESTVGEIVNLMSVDTQRLTELCGYLNIIWSAPLQIGLSLYFLWQILGPSVLAGVAIMILLLPINAVMATKARQYQMKQMKMKDKRIKLMNEILSGIKVLKLYAWEPSFEDQIMGIRGKEVKVLRKSALLTAGSIFVWTCAPFFVSAFTFATYVLVDEHNVLDAQKAFVSLTLFNIMRMPLNLLPMLIVFLVQASVSIKRINKYMNGEEINDEAVNHDPNEEDQVSVKNGNFSWKEDTPILRDINLSVKEGQLVAIVGTVGVGKSTLLSALLGEVDHQSGAVQSRGRIAYVAQQPWIQNATVRDNILFGLPYDSTKYDRVLDGCALRPDLEILQAGDSTEIGEKGINLSGGQKQRVALARATYNHADLYLLDDPLSAVDSHVARHLFDKVIGPSGILKRKTRILVTHGVTFLPQMDNIIVLSDGEISEQGTYKELLAKKGAFADFLIQHIASELGEEGALLDGAAAGEGGGVLDETATSIISDLQEALGSKEELVRRKSRLSESQSVGGEDDGGAAKYRRQFSKQISTVSAISKASAFSEGGESISDSGDFVSAPTSPLRRPQGGSQGSFKGSKTVMNGSLSVSAAGATAGKGEGVKDRLIEAEGAETGSVKLSVFLFYIRAVGVAMASSVLFLQLACQVFAVSSNLWLTGWANDNAATAAEGNGTQDAGKRDMYLAVYVSLGVGQGLATLVSATVMAYGSLRASSFLHYQMFHRILRAPMSFFDTTPAGRIVNRFGKDVDTADNAIPMAMSFWLNCLFWVLSTLIIICYVTPIFTFVVIPVAAFYFFAQRYYVATLRQLRRLESVTRSPIYSHFGETLTGTTTIRAFGMQERFITESEAKVDHNQTTYFPTIVANRFLAVALEMIGSFVILAAALLAVSSRGALSAGLVGLSVSYALQITQSLNWLVKMTTDVETNLVSVERLKEYGEVVQEADYENKNTKPPREWPASGQVVFEKYRTRYREGLDLVLQDVTCKIEPGEKVGIVGRTGAGKSSLTLSLFRLIEAVGGSIQIDGVDISKLGLHDVRRRLTIIPQDPIIFSGSLRLNLDPFNEHSDEDIWRALELAHLKPFVKGLGAGLSYELTEGGENLSVGQRQLVCLARALLRKSKILVLDEATAAIDLETDDLIQQTIRKEFAECTILTIAHRLNTIMDYGRVMVLDRGVISEFDTPETLLQNKNSIFYGMAKDAGLA